MAGDDRVGAQSWAGGDHQDPATGPRPGGLLAPAGRAPARTARAAHPARAGAPAPSLVEGHVPDRRRLLLDAGLPAGDRGARRRRALPRRHPGPGRGDAARRAAGLPPRRPGEPARRGLHRDAGAAAARVARQGVRPGPARVRGHRLPHHDDAVRGRRHRAPGAEPAGPRRAAGAERADHAAAARAARRGVPRRVLRGHPDRGRAGRGLPGAQRRRRGRRAGPDRHGAARRRGLVGAARVPLPGPAADGGDRADRVPRARAGPVRVRDRGVGDAAGPGPRR